MAGEEHNLPIVGDIAFDGDDHQRMKRVQWDEARVLTHHLASQAAHAYNRALLIVGRGGALFAEVGDVVDESEDGVRAYRRCAGCSEWASTLGRAGA